MVTVKMPRDVLDSEIYVKTPQEHSGILMDPWTSSTWKKLWNKFHTPSKVTKEIYGYSFNLYYVKGNNMILCDYLSRIAVDNGDPDEVIPFHLIPLLSTS